MTTKSLDVENVRIVVTDSGLGGISVLAELEHRLREAKIYKKAELIFFNSISIKCS